MLSCLEMGRGPKAIPTQQWKQSRAGAIPSHPIRDFCIILSSLDINLFIIISIRKGNKILTYFNEKLYCFYFSLIVCFLFCSLHFTAASHNGVTSYHTSQGSQALPTSEADFVSDLSQGT